MSILVSSSLVKSRVDFERLVLMLKLDPPDFWGRELENRENLHLIGSWSPLRRQSALDTPQ